MSKNIFAFCCWFLAFFIILFLIVIYLPFTSHQKVDLNISEGNGRINVFLNNSSEIDYQECENALGCFSPDENLVYVASKKQSWYSVTESCSHELYHYRLSGVNGSGHHSVIDELEFDGVMLPWNLKKDCIGVANIHVLRGELKFMFI